MLTFRVSAEVTDDRQVVLTLPPEVPLGATELIVCVAASNAVTKRPRSSLADWAERNAEAWGNRLDARDVESFTGRRA